MPQTSYSSDELIISNLLTASKLAEIFGADVNWSREHLENLGVNPRIKLIFLDFIREINLQNYWFTSDSNLLPSDEGIKLIRKNKLD
jgi:hypothetical protein